MIAAPGPMSWIAQLLAPREDPVVPSILDERGAVIYAIGDVHGRLDLLQRMIEEVDADSHDAVDRPVLVILGDMIDRGPRSAQVVDLILELRRDRPVVALMGNHERSMLDFVRAPRPAHPWLRNGGDETLRSYGATDLETLDARGLQKLIAAVIPHEHVSFFNSLPLAAESTSYFFSHAGIRPEAPLNRQSLEDVLWRRDGMGQDYSRVPKLVVHGHQALDKPSIGLRRINVDTGAHATGKLSAARLEPGRRPRTLTVESVGPRVFRGTPNASSI